MEAIEIRSEQWEETALDFGQFLRSVELNTEMTEVNRRNQVLLRKKNKESWLFKSKIIPPTFSKLGEENYRGCTDPQMMTLASFDYRKTTPLIGSEGEIRAISKGPIMNQNKENPFRNVCQTTHNIPRGEYRSKPNWKLEFRRDQLNVLKYMRQEEEVLSENKAFKVRKLQKKFQQLKASPKNLYRSNIDSIKQSIPKVRYRMVNSRQ